MREAIRIERVAFCAAREPINALHAACFDGRRLQADFGHGFWWLARDPDGEPVGFAGMHPSVNWEATGYLCRAGVAPRARGRGLQQRLIRVRLAAARRLGWRWVVTDTIANPASANNLIACGFRMYEPAKPWGHRGASYWRIDLRKD